MAVIGYIRHSKAEQGKRIALTTVCRRFEQLKSR